MKLNYLIIGLILSIFGLTMLMAAGNLIDIDIEDDDDLYEIDNEGVSVTASFGLVSMLGWSVFLTGAIILVIGLIAGPSYETFE